MGKKLWLFLTICMFTVSMAFAQQKVTGVVIEAETSEPVVGASVRVKGANIGAATNIEGKFTLEVPSSSSTLVVSYIGMKTKEVAVKPNVRIVLESESNNLSDVVVVAYGTQKKSSITGSVTKIDSKALEHHIATSATAALEGAAAGVQVNSSYGEPGEAPKIRIRGFSSINGENEPLYVVDGAPYNGNISEINPADIETWSILKDAASSALFGSRASNGVVMITTRRGKGGSVPQVSLTINQGVYTRGIAEYDRMDIKEWMETSRTALYNQYIYGKKKKTPEDAAKYASTHLISDYCKANIFDQDEAHLFDENGNLVANVLPGYQGDLDWQNDIERTGHRQEYVLSSQSSSEKSNFYTSVGYMNEKGYVAATEFERYTARVNGNFNPYKWLKTGLNVNAVVSTRNYNGSANGSYYINPFYATRYMAPIYSIHAHNSDGSIVLDEFGNPMYNFDKATLNNRNISYELRQDTQDRKRLSLNTSAFATIVLPYGFDITVKGTTDFATSNNKHYNNKNIGDGAANGGRLTTSAYQYRTLNFSELLNWSQSFGLHNVTFLGGHESYNYKYSYNGGMNTNMAVDGIFETSNFLTNSYYNGASYEDALESWLSRATYNFDEKYFAEVSFRTDKSSRFNPGITYGKDHTNGVFTSFGAAWNIKKEAFLSDVSWLNELKLRAAYGENGNNSAAGYQAYLSLYSIEKNGGKPALIKSQIGAIDAQWETTNTIDVAVEGSVFDRLHFTFDFFNKRSDKLLFDVRLPLSVGRYVYDEDYANPTILQNIGVIDNLGLEISLDYDVIKNQNWKWNLGTEGTFLKTKVVKLFEGKDIQHGQQRYSEGHDAFAWYTYHFVGIDRLDGRSLYTLDPDKRAAAASEGAIRKIDGQEYTLDTTYGLRDWAGKATPSFYGSFRSTLTWKDLTFNVLFTYSLGGKIMDSSYRSLMSTSASGADAYSKDLAKAWKSAPDGMTEESSNRIDPDGIPVVDFANNDYNNAVSDRWLTSSSYLIMKNLSLSYSLPKTITSRLGINGIIINGGVENLFTITSRKGLNPQYSFTGDNDDTYVSARVFNLGLKLNF